MVSSAAARVDGGVLTCEVMACRDNARTIAAAGPSQIVAGAVSDDTDARGRLKHDCRCVQSETVGLARIAYTEQRGVISVATASVLCRLSAVRITTCLRHADAIRDAMRFLSHVPVLVGLGSSGQRTRETRCADCGQLNTLLQRVRASAAFL
jgi:hypothetical protein